MKIGIMTFWLSEDNYGQLLQCFALQKYLRNAGHDAYIIRYDPKKDNLKTPFWRRILKVFNPVELYEFFSNKKKKKDDDWDNQNNPRYFEDFRNKYIKQSERIYFSYGELVKNPPEADIYIVGSDQVWNTFNGSINKIINKIKAYLLDFGSPSIKRIAYAASFGKEMIDDASIRVFTPLLKRFNYISVREKTGIDICKKCGIDNAEWAPDPTILLDADVYRSMYKNETIRKPERSYCFLYYLGNECDFSLQSIYDWAERKNLEIIYITGNSRHDKFTKNYLTIPEWICLLEGSEYIITNSYHGVIFALLFEKKFGIIPLKGRDKSMNGRFDSLFELFKIEKRFMYSDLSVLDNDIDWPSVSAGFKMVGNTSKLPEITETING